MGERKKIPTALYAEMTPNPATMKFVADRLLLTGGLQVEYQNKNEAKGSSPLAEELFNFPFVTNVFIANNFVTVTKDESLTWDMIVMQLREYMREWLMDNEIAVTTVPAHLMNRAPQSIASDNDEKIVSNPLPKFESTELDEAIQAILEEYVKPAVERDGGAIDFIGFKDKTVYVQMKGSCAGCPSSTATLKGGIENLLKAKFPESIECVSSI
ncbi:MAG: NifU family protein [Bacteroidetes bacterium]|nr:NifU family protein [Bacteroidota bacterium]